MKIKQRILRILTFAGKMLIAILLYVVILLPAWLIDMTYKGIIQYPFMIWIANLIRMFARCLGLSYSRAFELLSSSLGILITGISLMITIGTNIATRSENKIYGIPRLNLKFYNIAKWYRLASRSIFLSPLFFIYAINCSYCLTGYAILFYSYTFLTLSYFRLNDSFKPKANRELVVRNLVAVTVIGQDFELKEYLEEIRIEANKKENETEIRLLFEELLNKTQRESFERIYLCSYLFFDFVYMQDDLQRSWGMKFIQRKILELKREQTHIYSNDKSKKYIALWAMMSCFFDNVSEDLKLVDEFINWCIDLPYESLKDTTGNGICSDVYIMLMGLLLLQMECLYRKRKYRKINIEQLRTITTYGMDILQEKNDKLRAQMRCLGSLTNKSVHMTESISTLEETTNNTFGHSVVFNLLYLNNCTKGEKDS